jgi:hypothetical protein
MENSNAVKARLLGMPFGTANGKLRKKLLFHLARKLDMLDCFRCHELIVFSDEFSIEHTESWQYAKDPFEAFFDVEKIAFSHLDCNVRAGIRPQKGQWQHGASTYKNHKCKCDDCTKANASLRQEYRTRTGNR